MTHKFTRLFGKKLWYSLTLVAVILFVFMAYLDLNTFAKWWAINDELPQSVDLIGVVSYGAVFDELTVGTKEAIKQCNRLRQRYPTTKVVFGEFTGNSYFGWEKFRKLELIPDAIYAGAVLTAIEEGEKCREALPKDFHPTNIVFVTDEMHSRSAKRIWNRVWNGPWYKRFKKWMLGEPMVSIFISVIPSYKVIDPKNPMTNLRDQRKWALANVLREAWLTFVPFGYTLFKKLGIHQPIAK